MKLEDENAQLHQRSNAVNSQLADALRRNAELVQELRDVRALLAEAQRVAAYYHDRAIATGHLKV